MSYLIVSLLAAPLVLTYAIWYYFLIPPSGFPKNIPTIPFYVTLLSLVKDVDQTKLYREYFEKPLAGSGAVKMWWGSRWSILVERPEYLRELFKHADVYTKSGNYAKNPHSVIGEYVPENIITNHGEQWKKYSDIIKPALQRQFDVGLILGNAKQLVGLFRDASNEANGRGVNVVPLLQRYALANLCQGVFSADLVVSRLNSSTFRWFVPD